MFVIAELVYVDYDEFEIWSVYGPYRSENKAKKVYDKLMKDVRKNINYEIRKLEKLDI